MGKPKTRRLEPRTRISGTLRPVPRKTLATKATASLADVAYEKLKLDIISLLYRPGAYINEAKICEDLGLGRTPVHHAVTRLAHERMLEIIPRKGIIVSPVSLQEVMASVEVRLILEPQCARLAAERATLQDIEAIESVLKRAKKSIPSRDVMGLMNADRDFHSVLARSARNELLEDILKRLHERSLRFWFISLSDPQHMLGVDEEHWQVLRAMRAHDTDAAEAAMRSHIESFRDNIRASV